MSDKHSLKLYDDRLDICGVTKVISYDDKEVILSLVDKELVLQGENLALLDLSLDDKTSTVTGIVNSIKYKKATSKLGFIKRITK